MQSIFKARSCAINIYSIEKRQVRNHPTFVEIKNAVVWASCPQTKRLYDAHDMRTHDNYKAVILPQVRALEQGDRLVAIY